MFGQVFTIAYKGVEALEIAVEVYCAPGLPAFVIVGLPDKTVAESKERVRMAFHSIGFGLPAKKITVNLAPADLLKEGSHFDLPIALSIMAAFNIIPKENIGSYVILGELSLNGTINKVCGVLPASVTANSLDKGIICPRENYAEARWSGNPNILAPRHLLEIINHFKEKQFIITPLIEETSQNTTHKDLKDVQGQRQAKRSLEIAAAGGHNMLMIGPPGAGKSMIAKRITGILPPLSSKEMLEVSSIYSIAGIVPFNGIVTERPFREPHSSSSVPAMVGGGKNAKPGEVTLAHQGVLFMDELPEFSRYVLESLRQPMESGDITIARANSHITYPAEFQLIAAMNPCRCGFYGDARRACSKVPKCAEDYQAKISGPLLDRFDLQVEVFPMNPYFEETDSVEKKEESSSLVAERVMKARQIQAKRFPNLDMINARLDGEELEKYCHIEGKEKELLKQAIEKYQLSMRGINKVRKVARTIADLEVSEKICYEHLLEALRYRVLPVKS